MKHGFRTYCFTLIEIIIAVSIFLLIALSLFMYSSGVTRSWEHTVKRRNNLNEMLVLDRTFAAVLPNIIPFTWKNRDDDNKAYPFVLATSDRLRCAYLHRLNDEEEGAIRFCEIYLEDGKVYMSHVDRPFYDWSEVRDRTVVSLLTENVEELHFLYVDWNADSTEDWWNRMEWRDDWENEESGRDDVPLAVLLSIRWEDGTEENWMYRTMGNGYRERYGEWSPQEENEAKL